MNNIDETKDIKDTESIKTEAGGFISYLSYLQDH